tara:strand:- start:2003 stop:5338 length:3336 start_codon:yes stop_codon:yes gene_type:complete
MTKETTLSANTTAKKNVSLFGSAIFEGGMRIFNFQQENPNDFNLETDLANGDATIMLDSKYLEVNQDLFVNTKINNKIFLRNPTDACIIELQGNSLVKKHLNLEDNFGACDYLTEGFLIANKNFIFNNKNIFTEFSSHMDAGGYKNTAIDIHQDFIVENNIETKKNIQVSNILNVNTIKYNNVTISNQITVLNNFNSYANLNINTLNVSNKLTCSNIIVDDSIFIQNNALYLPNISIHNNIDGSIRYNDKKHVVEGFIQDKWRCLNRIQNYDNVSYINHEPYYKPHVGMNIDFVQNNNLILSLNNNNKTNYINNQYTNLKHMYIKQYLTSNNTFQTEHNTNVGKNIIVNNNFLLKDTSLFTILHNKSISNPINGIIRYNDKINKLECYINKWHPLQHITNNSNTSNIDLYPKNIYDYDTILFNSAKSVFLNITQSTTQFNLNTINVKENLNLTKNLIIHNNLNTKTLKLSTNNIYKNGNYLINDITNNVSNRISSDKFILNSSTDFNIIKYIFYSSLITQTSQKCNIINSIVENTEFINNYSIFITKYKLYQSLTISNIILHLNQLPTETVIFTIKIKNINTTFTITTSSEKSTKQDVNIPITATNISPYDLFIEIFSDKNIPNLFAKIELYATYKNMTGNLLNNGSHIYIDQPNDFNVESRKILGNTNITGNANIENKLNINIPHLFLNTIGIGTIIQEGDFIIKNNSNTTFIHKNNKIGIGTNNPTSSLTIHSNINSNSISTGSIILDKNMNNTGTLNILGNLVGLNNINIKNTLIKDIIDEKNLFIKNNITFKKNITSNFNINITKNINITNTTIYPNLIFTKNSQNSNIIFNNNVIQFNIDKTLHKLTNYPSNNSQNKIYIEDKNDIFFKYNNKSLLQITNESISTNNDSNDNNNILNISSNFNITKDNINISSNHFIINNIDLLEKIKDIERCYYSPYNINCSKINDGINNKFNISYNKPQLYGNLNNYINHNIKYIDYIGFQFCLGNINTNIHQNWTTNSFIYYKNKNQIQFNHNAFSYNNTLSINTINKTNYQSSNVTYDFNNQIHTYNLNIENDKTQLIYNTSDSCIFTSNISNQHLSLRMFPIYNTRDKELYYSNPINFKLD